MRSIVSLLPVFLLGFLCRLPALGAASHGSGGCLFGKTQLERLIVSAHPPAPALARQVSQAREGFIGLALMGTHQRGGPLPILLTQHAIDTLRATPVLVADLDSLNPGIMALHTTWNGRSLILLNPVLAELDANEVEDIIIHEYIHEVDKLLAGRLLPTSGLGGYYSEENDFNSRIFRDSSQVGVCFVRRAYVLANHLARHIAPLPADTVQRAAAFRVVMRAWAPQLVISWRMQAYFNDPAEVFTRYVMLKRWLVQHKRLRSLYDPFTAADVDFVLES